MIALGIIATIALVAASPFGVLIYAHMVAIRYQDAKGE